MMMMGLHFMGEAPFRRVFINALVRDEQGAKMSKAKGNVLDPLEIVDVYGADALRFTLTAMSGANRDIKLSTQRIEGYRNFGTKLWNAARFCQINGCVRDPSFDPALAKSAPNRWIRGEIATTAKAVTAALDACAFDDAASHLYRFIWNVFCDWNVEFAKPVLAGNDDKARVETRAMTAWVLDIILRFLHPVMPFITEALWEQTGGEGLLMIQPWPELPDDYVDEAASDEMRRVIAVIAEGRSIRSELNVPASARPPLLIIRADDHLRQELEANAAIIGQMLRISGLEFVSEPGPGAAPCSGRGTVPLMTTGGK